jgi:hypothetical protein
MASMASVSFIGGPDPAVEIGFTLGAGSGGDGSATRQCVILAEGVAAGTGGDDEVSAVLATAGDCTCYSTSIPMRTFVALGSSRWLQRLHRLQTSCLPRLQRLPENSRSILQGI